VSVTDDAGRDAVVRIGRAALGERLGGFVYGTIVVLAVVVAGAKAYPDQPGYVAGLVAITTGVFWLAHVYSHALAHSVSRDVRLSLSELRQIARREAALIEAGALPVAALLLGAIGILAADTAVWLALGLGLAVLAAEGFVFARAERLGLLGSLGVVAANLTLGLLVVAMKLIVTH
jgi:hypothetical protein